MDTIHLKKLTKLQAPQSSAVGIVQHPIQPPAQKMQKSARKITPNWIFLGGDEHFSGLHWRHESEFFFSS